ncbi:MAG: type II secretion system protein [Sarcina sp.]
MLKGNKRILKNFKQKKKAFTLLEIVVALGIVAIMIMTLGGALVTSVKANKMGEIKQESKLISQEIIEKLRSIGDVKDTVLNVGNNQGDTVEILGNPAGGFDVKGTLTDSSGTTMVKGTIKQQSKVEEQYGSSQYLDKEFDLFIYVQGTKGNNKISYFTESNILSGEKMIIDNYLDRSKIVGIVEGFTDSKELNLEIIKDGVKDKVIVKNGTDKKVLMTAVSKIKNIAIYVEEQRTLDKTVDLHLNSGNGEKIQLYIFNNKFHALDYTIGDPITDSFKDDRYINGEFSIYDNITYYPENERLNKGLYTIELEFNKKVPNGSTVTEKTRSEFMVDN